MSGFSEQSNMLPIVEQVLQVDDLKGLNNLKNGVHEIGGTPNHKLLQGNLSRKLRMQDGVLDTNPSAGTSPL